MNKSSKKFIVLLNENISDSEEKIEEYFGKVISLAVISLWLDSASSSLVAKFLMKRPISGYVGYTFVLKLP